MKEGLLDSSRLTWSSSLNVPLGSGNSLSLNAMDLPEGIHTITLTASNSTALAGSAAVSIQVLRTRPTLPATLAVGPAALTFTAAVGSTPPASQQVALRNSGDGDLNWTASANQNWLHLDAASGTTPTNLSITADPAGLAVGQYTANVMIASPSAANSPQVVNVILSVTAFASISQPDCFFNWAERTYPTFFAPAGVISNTLTPYYFRYYPQSNAYLGTSSADNHVYYFGPLSNSSLLDLGALSGWLATAGCQ